MLKYMFMIKRKRPAGHNGWGDLHQEQTEVAKAGHLPVIINLMHCNVLLVGNWGQLVTMFISYRPGPSQKTECLWVFYSDTPNIHNMFRLTPWSHGIWFSTDKNLQRSQETGPYFHFLSETLTESESREKVSFKLQPLRGLGFVPLSLSSFVLEPLLVENNPPVSTGARTPPSKLKFVFGWKQIALCLACIEGILSERSIVVVF